MNFCINFILSLPKNREGEFAHEGLVTSLRHKDCLTACKKSLDEALNVSKRNLGEECLALEIHSACDSLGEVVGEVFTDDILKVIFSKFCIGK